MKQSATTAAHDGGAAAAAGAFRYDARTIALHWATVAAVLALWCIGQTVDWFPKGAARINYRSAHITLGVLLAALLLVRIWWRATGGRRLPAAAMSTQQRVASALHLLLYALLLATVAAGLSNVWVRGDSLFQLYTVPALDPGNKDLVEQVGDIHALLANSLLVAVLLHAAAALYHHYIARDDVLRRMTGRSAP